ncbi:type VI secretion protein [Pseudomonas citri]|nr:type VI secretion protein [Pseudomonas citri]
MPVHCWQTILLSFVVLSAAVGCSGNYKFNDAGYRPLGDPQAVNRRK